MLRVSCVADDVIDYFSSFGRVQQCMIKYDTETGEPRGFGFVLFHESDSLDKVLTHIHPRYISAILLVHRVVLSSFLLCFST